MLGGAVMELRPYQVEAIERIRKAEARGVRRQLGVAATGLGKTIVFCALAKQMNVRTLVVAHRDELIEQAAAKVKEVWPEADVGVVKGARDEVSARVVVASVQTLARTERLARLLEPTLLDLPPFGLVIVDEAHHAAAVTYRNVMHALRCGEADGPLLLGVTATPDRGDGKGLDDLFDEVTFAYDLRWGIARGFLSDLKGLRVRLSKALDVKVTRGDYDQGQAGAWLEDAGAPALIARALAEHAQGRRTLVFTPTVATAQLVVDECRARGIRAASVDGAMAMDDRRATLAAYAAGDIDVIANCMVLTEGYDEPRTDCIVVARPTKSRALYTQMVGRGTRVHVEKTDCLVIDVVGASDEHDLVTIPSLFGIERPERMWADGATATEALHEQIEQHAAQGRLLAAEADLFDKVRSTGRMAWVAAHHAGDVQKRYHLSLGSKHGYCAVVQRFGDLWRAGYCDADGVKRVLMDDVSLELGQGVCEDLARKLGVDRLVSIDAAWRDERPSKKQKAAAKRLGIIFPADCTKGQASDLLGARFAHFDARKQEVTPS